ncbi:hypothetical protein [Candidatus Alkanophaga liquidiphilum]
MPLKDLKIIFRRISMVVGFLIPIYFILPQVFVSLRCGATGNRAFEGYADNKGTVRHEQGAFGILCVRNPRGGVGSVFERSSLLLLPLAALLPLDVSLLTMLFLFSYEDDELGVPERSILQSITLFAIN